MKYTPVLGTLGYIMSPDGEKILLLHRNKREDDFYFGKYIGLGGKLNSNEDVISGIKREIFEESGLICEKLTLCGTINWLDINSVEKSWFGFIFRVDAFQGELKLDTPEGTLAWVPRESIYNLPMSEGDDKFLPLVFDNTRQFHGVMIRGNDNVISWKYSFTEQ